MKNNWPVKYAVFALTESGAITDSQDNSYSGKDIINYIILKCYIVGDMAEYKIDGSVKRKYKVVPPYTKESSTRWKREDPKFSGYGACSNCMVAEDVFDTYEDAYGTKMKKNATLIHGGTKEQKDLDRVTEECERLEKAMNDGTPDLRVDNKAKDQIYSIIYDKEYDSLGYGGAIYDSLETPDREYIYDSRMNYRVYTVSEEELRYLKENFERKVSDPRHTEDVDKKKFMHTPLFMHRKGDNFVKLFLPSKESMYLSIGRHIEPVEQNVDYKNLRFEETRFTSETYEDILLSYKLGKKQTKQLDLTLDCLWPKYEDE